MIARRWFRGRSRQQEQPVDHLTDARAARPFAPAAIAVHPSRQECAYSMSQSVKCLLHSIHALRQLPFRYGPQPLPAASQSNTPSNPRRARTYGRGCALLLIRYSCQMHAQLGRRHHDVRRLQVSELGRYRRQLLRTPESVIGFLPPLHFQKLQEILKMEALPPVQGTLVAVDRLQQSLEPAREFEKRAPGIIRLNGHAHTRWDATARQRGEVVSTLPAISVAVSEEKRGPAHPAGLSYTTIRSPQIDRVKTSRVHLC